MKTIKHPEKKKNGTKAFTVDYRKTVTVEGQQFKEVEVNLTNEDNLAHFEYPKYFKKIHGREPSSAERINGIIDIANSLEELSLSDTEGKAFMKQMKFVPVDRLEQLQHEASKSGVTLHQYLRAIYFSVGQYLKDKRIKEERESLKQVQAQRNIAATYYVTPVERKAIEAKHGAMSEKQLQDFLHKFARQQVKEVYVK